MNKEDPTQGISDWWQPFTDNLEDLETHVPAHSCGTENSDSEGDASRVEIQEWKHSIETHFRKYRNCDICLRTEITSVPCRRRDEGSILRTEKYGVLTTAEHNVRSEGRESRNNHRFAAVVQDLTIQWILSMWEQKFAGDGEESMKVSWAVAEAKSYLDERFIRIWQVLWRSIMESSNSDTSSIRDKRNCTASCTSSKRRDISLIIAIWIEWWMVVGFHEMLLLSVTCP